MANTDTCSAFIIIMFKNNNYILIKHVKIKQATSGANTSLNFERGI